MTKFRAKVHLTRSASGRLTVTDERPVEAPTALARVPRVARLMALAIRFDRLLREGRVKSLTEVAALARVTQPRVTQILNLTLLAPDIQELVLSLRAADSGRELITERTLRPVVAEANWRDQRRLWAAIAKLALRGE